MFINRLISFLLMHLCSVVNLALLTFITRFARRYGAVAANDPSLLARAAAILGIAVSCAAYAALYLRASLSLQRYHLVNVNENSRFKFEFRVLFLPFAIVLIHHWLFAATVKEGFFNQVFTAVALIYRTSARDGLSLVAAPIPVLLIIFVIAKSLLFEIEIVEVAARKAEEESAEAYRRLIATKTLAALASPAASGALLSAYRNDRQARRLTWLRHRKAVNILGMIVGSALLAASLYFAT